MIQNITVFSHLLPLLFFLFFLTRNKGIDIRVILFYCIYSFANDQLLLWPTNTLEKKSFDFFLLSLFTLIEYSVFAYFIYQHLKNGYFRKLILLVSPLFLAFSIILFLQSASTNIDSISITVENILIIIFCLLYFFGEVKEPNTIFIYSTYNFWIIAGILLYSTSTFFLFMQSDNLPDKEWYEWKIINDVFTVVKNIFFSVAITMKKDGTAYSYLEKPDED